MEAILHENIIGLLCTGAFCYCCNWFTITVGLLIYNLSETSQTVGPTIIVSFMSIKHDLYMTFIPLQSTWSSIEILCMISVQ